MLSRLRHAAGFMSHLITNSFTGGLQPVAGDFWRSCEPGCSPVLYPKDGLVAGVSLLGSELCALTRAIPGCPTSSAEPLINLVLNLTSG